MDFIGSDFLTEEGYQTCKKMEKYGLYDYLNIMSGSLEIHKDELPKVLKKVNVFLEENKTYVMIPIEDLYIITEDYED